MTKDVIELMKYNQSGQFTLEKMSSELGVSLRTIMRWKSEEAEPSQMALTNIKIWLDRQSKRVGKVAK